MMEVKSLSIAEQPRDVFCLTKIFFFRNLETDQWIAPTGQFTLSKLLTTKKLKVKS